MTRAVVTAFAVAASSGATTQTAAQPAVPIMALVPERIELGSDPVRVELTISGAPAIGGFSVDLLFDPAVVAVTGITLGDWLGSTGRPVQPLGPHLGDPGRATLGALMAGDEPAPEGDGTLAVLMLAGLGTGESAITLSKPVLVGLERNSPPITPATGDAIAVVSAIAPEAVLAAASAATELASTPRAGLDPDFVAAVESEATREAPGFDAAVAPAIASFTPVDAAIAGSAATPAATDSPRPSVASGRNLALLAVLVAVSTFVWVVARRESPA